MTQNDSRLAEDYLEERYQLSLEFGAVAYIQGRHSAVVTELTCFIEPTRENISPKVIDIMKRVLLCLPPVVEKLNIPGQANEADFICAFARVRPFVLERNIPSELELLETAKKKFNARFSPANLDSIISAIPSLAQYDHAKPVIGVH